jgi:hypothetical protein
LWLIDFKYASVLIRILFLFIYKTLLKKNNPYFLNESTELETLSLNYSILILTMALILQDDIFLWIKYILIYIIFFLVLSFMVYIFFLFLISMYNIEN